jgi:hypothetical protein
MGLPVNGNSGEGRTAFVAAVIRLSQNTSSVFVLVPAGFALRAGGIVLSSSARALAMLSDGNSRPLVVGNW